MSDRHTIAVGRYLDGIMVDKSPILNMCQDLIGLYFRLLFLILEIRVDIVRHIDC